MFCTLHAVKATYLWNHFVSAALFILSPYSIWAVWSFFFFLPFLKIFLAALMFLSVLAAKKLRQVQNASVSLSKHVGNSLDSGKTETFWSVLFSVFLFSSFFLYPKQQGVIFVCFSSFSLLGVWKAQVNGQTWVSIKKGFLNLWNYVQHVSYINIYLKYKSILLLLDFGFFYI